MELLSHVWFFDMLNINIFMGIWIPKLFKIFVFFQRIFMFADYT